MLVIKYFDLTETSQHFLKCLMLNTEDQARCSTAYGNSNSSKKNWKTLIAHLKPYSSYISIQNSWRKVLKNRTISHFSGYICKVNALQKFRNRRLHKHRFICNNSFVAMKSEFKHIISFLSRRQNRDPLVHLEWPV